eukprot:CAMPEP_0204631388 /NCGR_PEP_ID=MMETSP0717-20131115/22584_1 /ASSEMBLY_ACC=CAM_ASM_000666 /TAXON_ID=230516 /ORGANISM="Chaetoceros curvisetus" /LENGTH=39 /DNA_ID= /DNA_START= /DNA_END= /DNA_ORIENTATION=
MTSTEAKAPISNNETEKYGKHPLMHPKSTSNNGLVLPLR